MQRGVWSVIFSNSSEEVPSIEVFIFVRYDKMNVVTVSISGSGLVDKVRFLLLLLFLFYRLPGFIFLNQTMIKQKGHFYICHPSHLHKTYSHICHNRCYSTKKIITIHGLSALPLENMVCFIPDIKCAYGSYVGETKWLLLTRMNPQTLLITGLNNPISSGGALFRKHFWPPWLQKHNCLCNWNVTT